MTFNALRAAALAVSAFALLPFTASAHVTDRTITFPGPDGSRIEAEVHGHTQNEVSLTAQRRMSQRLGKTVSLSRGALWTNPMPQKWCGSVRSTDDQEHAIAAPGSKVIKVVYAYAADDPNRLHSGVADVIQQQVRDAMSFVMDESSGLKSIRFDLGNECGAQYVDITTVALSGPRSKYTSGRSERWQNAMEEISTNRAKFGIAEDVNILAYIDQVSNDSLAGEAIWVDDDDPRPEVNQANKGGLYGALYGVPDSEGVPASDSFYTFYELLHEVTHLLGAVNTSAPNATRYGHCTDEIDVLCYDDGGAPAMTSPCPQTDQNAPSSNNGRFDCNNNDYFSPSPAPGSYLATHWNVFNSSFLCQAAECVTPDTTPPGQPAQPQIVRNRKGYTLMVRWTARPANEGVSEWKVQVNGKTTYPQPSLRATPSTIQARFKQKFRAGRRIKVQVIAVDAAGNRSAASPVKTVTVAGKKKRR